MFKLRYLTTVKLRVVTLVKIDFLYFGLITIVEGHFSPRLKHDPRRAPPRRTHDETADRDEP